MCEEYKRAENADGETRVSICFYIQEYEEVDRTN